MTTYSIQLDNLDLALLPVQSLSYNHFLKKEQFQFQLLIKEETEDPTITHPCHICAIDVPTAFWSKHCAGAKHRANARMATAAAKRTSALITATPPPITPLTTEKFCDSCTCIAGKDHEKTKAHKLSVTHDRMLFNLVMIYTGEDVNDDQREKENKTDSKYAKKDKDKEVDVNVTKREVGRFSSIENNEGPTANTPYEKDIADIDLNVVKLNVDQFSGVENEKQTTTKILNENIQQNADEKILDVEIETTPSNDTQLSTFEDEMSNAILLPDQDESQKTTSTIPEDNGDRKVKKTRTRKRKNKSQLGSETNIITTENPNEDTSSKELNVPDPNKVLDIKDAFVSYYPLVDESAVHYPFIKDMLHVRCLICDCIVPRAVYNRVTHLKGRPHAANAKKQLHIVKDAFILAKKQLNDIK